MILKYNVRKCTKVGIRDLRIRIHSRSVLVVLGTNYIAREIFEKILSNLSFRSKIVAAAQRDKAQTAECSRNDVGSRIIPTKNIR